MKNNPNGFTLIEMLLVLSLLSIFIILAVPIKKSINNTEQDKRFLEILQYDVLYIQNLARTSWKEKLSIRFLSDHYIVLQNERLLYKRPVPNHWIIQPNTVQDVSFTIKGTIRESGNLFIKSSEATYKFICPLGKGRCYIEKM